jgi:glutathione-regulated potassium-efflux system ancillary protein KefC
MEHGAWLTGLLIYLAAAVIAVPVAKFLGLGSIIGYLGAGVLIGPWGFKLVTNAESMLGFAEFGVVLMLFLIGLELEPQRLWSSEADSAGAAALRLGRARLRRWRHRRLAVVVALGWRSRRRSASASPSATSDDPGESVLSVALLQDIAMIDPGDAAFSYRLGQRGGPWLGAVKAAARSPRSSSAAGCSGRCCADRQERYPEIFRRLAVAVVAPRR